MRARELARAVGVIAAVAVVIVAAAFAGGLLLSSPTDASASVDAPAYDVDELGSAPVADEGSVSAPSGDEAKTVVVDRSHGNAVSENDLQPFVDALVDAGHDVRFYSGGSSSVVAPTQSGSAFNETLRGADAFVAASPATAYTDAQIDGVEAFADAGGRVLLAADPPSTGTTTTTVSIPGLTSGTTASAAGQPANLAARFDVTFGAGYLYDLAENGNHFQRVYAGGDGGVGDGVSEAVMLDATSLETGPDASPVLSAADVSLSTTRETGEYAVAARNGNVLALGDVDVLTEGVVSDGDNDVLASNVAAFLVGGDKEPGAPSDGSGAGGQQPPTTGVESGANAGSGGSGLLADAA